MSRSFPRSSSTAAAEAARLRDARGETFGEPEGSEPDVAIGLSGSALTSTVGVGPRLEYQAILTDSQVTPTQYARPTTNNVARCARFRCLRTVRSNNGI